MPKFKTKLKILTISFFLLLGFFGLAGGAEATQYFYYDAENCTNGDSLPMPPFYPYSDFRTAERIGKCFTDSTAPEGSRIMRWDVTYQGMTDQLTEVKPFSPMPTDHTIYYYAFFVRFDRINSVDIWPEGAPDTESFDKSFEIIGNGIRWLMAFGERGMGNQDHHFSVLVGNPTYHLNPELEVWDSYYQNYNGYSKRNSIQLEYEKWYSIVFKMKWATDNTGEIGLWVNGIKVMEFTNIKTIQSPGTFERLQMFGTYCQPAYNCPPHYRKVDAIIFTDNWQDIVDGGYLQDPNQQSDITPPAPPSGLAIN